jgi:hypothetical protein
MSWLQRLPFKCSLYRYSEGKSTTTVGLCQALVGLVQVNSP